MCVDDEKVAISILNKKDLIAGAIQKHKRFLEEYTAEFEELDTNIKSLSNQIEAAKNNRDNIELRTDVLKEKRQQLYHQVDNILVDVFSLEVANALDQKTIRTINEGIVKLRTSIPVEEEKQIVSEIISNLSVLAANIPEAQELVLQTTSRMNDALGSTVELYSIDGTDNKYNDEYIKLNTQLKKILPRHRLLENKIKNHRQGLTYWENIEAGNVTDGSEVMAS
ncbi:MAG: hypothetical protein JXA38_07075 [Methanosarcinaceae archaeon]|nr:hypothetical protein [Methanosarcinaceae archaeon]